MSAFFDGDDRALGEILRGFHEHTGSSFDHMVTAGIHETEHHGTHDAGL